MRRWGSALLWAGGISVVLLLCCGGPATLVKAVVDGIADNLGPTGDNESGSMTESRERGVLVAEWSVVPSEVEVPGGRVQFGEAWVEERSRSTHRLVWFPAEERVGGYRVHVAYTLQNDRDAGGRVGIPAELMFVPDDLGVGHVIGRAAQGRGVYTHLIDDPDVTGLRLSVVGSFDAPRAKNIRLLPKSQ